MDYQELYKKAVDIAKISHQGSKDIFGDDYIETPFLVSAYLDGYDAKIVAILNHIIDNDIDMYTRIQKNFPSNITEAVFLLGSPRNLGLYLEKIQKNNLARKVKIAELKVLSDVRKIKKYRKEDYHRITTYKKMIKTLSCFNCEYCQKTIDYTLVNNQKVCLNCYLQNFRSARTKIVVSKSGIIKKIVV